MDTTGQRWSISRNSGIDQADPVQNAMNAFTDLVMNFHMQREIAGREGSQALKSILLTD